MKLSTLATALVASIAAPLSTPAEIVELDTERPPAILKYQWITGKTYTQKTTMNQVSAFSIAGQDINQKMRMEMGITMSVEAVEGNKGRRITTKYDRVAMRMDMNGMVQDFDSDDPEAGDPGMAAAMGGLVGKSIVMLLGEGNEIVGVEGVDELMKAAGGDPAAEEMMRQMLDKEQLKQMTNAWIVQAFPEHAVKPGDKWPFEVDFQMGQLGSLTFKGTYKLAGYRDFKGKDCAVLEMKANLNVDFGGDGDGELAEAFRQLGMKVEGGSVKATMIWDNEIGWSPHTDMRTDMEMTMKDPTDDQEIKVPISQKMKIESTVE